MKVPFPARPLRTAIVAAFLVAAAPSAHAFCGFFVGKADATLGNKSSQVIVARNEQKTVISMLNEYRGELAQVALVEPLRAVLQPGQIDVKDRKKFDDTSTAIAKAHDELSAAEERWLELEMLREEIEQA